MRATRIIWAGAGRPDPVEYDGAPVPRRTKGLAPSCSMCGDGDPGWLYGDAFSDNFRTLTATDRMFPHALDGHPTSLCAACVWCAKTLALRCACFFAREDGVWWASRRDLLSHLLSPPEPPFVAGAPLYGADHGGEQHLWRCQWPGRVLPEGVDILARLQAKHCAVYAEVAYSRERYPLQIDDTMSVTVDVPLWRALSEHMTALATALRSGGVGYTETRAALATLRPPSRAPIAVHRDWRALTAPLTRYARAPWWSTLADILPMPDLVKAERPAKAKAAPVPAPTPDPPPPAHEPTPAPRAQLTLF